jgi:hypothetical protein
MLSDCHAELSDFLPGPLESLAAAHCVERHRFDWRPETVHTVLFAESHVYTRDPELQPMHGECEQQNRWTNDHARRWTTGHHAT